MRPLLTSPNLWPTLLLALALPVAAEDQFANFPDDDLEARIAAVNDGELRFLPEPTAKPVHRHQNEIEIAPASLDQGWVELRQCHRHLDPVPAAEIVFRAGRARGLRVLSSQGIGAARPEGASVQLRDVQPGAELCLALQSRALEALPGGGYRLRNGPYMRRFLDGYYPMEVSIRVRYPAQLLALQGFDPAPQPGFRLHTAPGEIELDARFEGRLHTRFDFCLRSAPDCPVAANDDLP